MLLSHGDIPAGVHGGIHYHSPMGFMAYNHAFEYLSARVTFLQGLFNWLGSVALQFTIRQPEESEAAHRMNLHISSWLWTMILIVLQFYNDHITFYSSCKCDVIYVELIPHVSGRQTGAAAAQWSIYVQVS